MPVFETVFMSPGQGPRFFHDRVADAFPSDRLRLRPVESGDVACAPLALNRQG